MQLKTCRRILQVRSGCSRFRANGWVQQDVSVAAGCGGNCLRVVAAVSLRRVWLTILSRQKVSQSASLFCTASSPWAFSMPAWWSWSERRVARCAAPSASEKPMRFGVRCQFLLQLASSPYAESAGSYQNRCNLHLESCPACSQKMPCGAPLPGGVMASKRRTSLPIISVSDGLVCVMSMGQRLPGLSCARARGTENDGRPPRTHLG